MDIWDRYIGKRKDDEGLEDLTQRQIDKAKDFVRQTTGREPGSIYTGIEEKLGYEVKPVEAALIPGIGLGVKIAVGFASIFFPPLALVALPAGVGASAVAAYVYHKRHRIKKGNDNTVAAMAERAVGKARSELEQRVRDYREK